MEKPDGIQKTSMSTPQEIRSLAPNNGGCWGSNLGSNGYDMDADPECQREARRVADSINSVIELRHEIDDAKLERQRMYTLPTQSKSSSESVIRERCGMIVGQSNKENLSLMFTGIAGAAASAVHPIFLVVGWLTETVTYMFTFALGFCGRSDKCV